MKDPRFPRRHLTARNRREWPDGWWIFPGALFGAAVIWGVIVMVPL